MNYLTQGDTQPVTFEHFRDADGYPVPTNTVTSVKFSLKNRSTGAVPVNQAACTITSSGSDGLVCTWSPLATDLDTAGEYDGELVIQFANGKVKRYPEQAGTFLFTVRAKSA
jgi:hypothetical protein